MKTLLHAITAVLVASASCSALAVPILWTLDLVPGEQGQMITGSFVYDQDTRTISNVNIVTLPGEDGPGGWDNGLEWVFTSAGAVYDGVSATNIDPDGYLSDVDFTGSPVGSPELVSYLYLSFFPIGNVNCFINWDNYETCIDYAGPPPGPAGLNMSRIGATWISEGVCLSGPTNGYPYPENCPTLQIAERRFSEVHMLTPQVVPIPPAAWLFAGALGVLGWTRRRSA